MVGVQYNGKDMPRVENLAFGGADVEWSHLVFFGLQRILYLQTLSLDLLKNPNCSGLLGSCHHFVLK